MRTSEAVVSLLPKNKANYDIFDVGSGPRCSFGCNIKGKKVNLICCDPLAEHYKKIYIKYNIPITFDILSVDGEKLLETFRYNSFDLVMARNCLDHAYSPEQAILQMATVSKKNILLLHCLNEGQNAGYHGLHQWDFGVSDGHFIISQGHSDVRTNFTLKYAHLFDYSLRTFDQDFKDETQHWVELILTKK